MTAASMFDRIAARGLALLQGGVRTVPPDRRASLTRRFKPPFDRAMARVARPELRDDERALRASIAVEPDDGELWLALGHRLAARRRNRMAVDALITSAARGARLSSVTLALLTRPSLHRIAGSEQNVRRMRRIAEADPDSAEKQLLVGAFLLDQGLLEPGRATVQRGYELLLSTEVPVLEGEFAPTRSHPKPDFLILGPPKTGTTSLYAFLAEHPHVVPTPRKELQFWNHRYGRSTEIFEAYFPPHLPPGFVTGEASINSLTTPEAAWEVAANYPAVRAIVLHRDPVARAYSDYQMRRRYSTEGRIFDQATAFEMRRIGHSPPLEMAEAPDVTDSYLLRSCILPYLRVWVDALGPEQVMVVESAELSKNRQATVDAVHDFLGLSPSSIAEQSDRNIYGYDPIPEATARRLYEWFAPHEEALEEYLAAHPTVVRSADG